MKDAAVSSSMRWLAAAAIALLGAGGCENAADGPAQAPAPALLRALEGPEQLRDAFVGAAGHPRLLLFLSPT